MSRAHVWQLIIFWDKIERLVKALELQNLRILKGDVIVLIILSIFRRLQVSLLLVDCAPGLLYMWRTFCIAIPPKLEWILSNWTFGRAPKRQHSDLNSADFPLIYRNNSPKARQIFFLWKDELILYLSDASKLVVRFTSSPFPYL